LHPRTKPIRLPNEGNNVQQLRSPSYRTSDGAARGSPGLSACGGIFRGFSAFLDI